MEGQRRAVVERGRGEEHGYGLRWEGGERKKSSGTDECNKEGKVCGIMGI